MKYLVLTCLLSILLFCCSKNPDINPTPEPPGDPFTVTPPLKPVITSLMVYTNNDQRTDPISLSHNLANIPYNSSYQGFNTLEVSTDQFRSVVYTPSTSKTFYATEAVRNYVDLRMFPVEPAGGFLYDYSSGNFPLPAGGTIDLPPYSFGTHSGSVYLYAYVAYLHPSINDYAVTLPSYPFTDKENKRWFLQSLGIYKLIPVSYEVADAALDFNPNVNVEIKIPIVQSQQSIAPDSIAAYTLNGDNVWTETGYAHRSGNFYVKQITKRGCWNFAIPVPAVYVTLKLRTADSTAVYNTRLKIRSGSEEVADVRTNTGGDAVIFVPVGKPLTYELINDHFNSWGPIVPTPTELGTFTKATEKLITLPGRIDRSSFTASVFNCDGTPMKSGVAVLASIGAKDKYAFPIVDGAFSASAWINAGYDLAEITILDNTGIVLSNNRVIFGSALQNSWEQEIKTYALNFYGCQDAQQVFCNYTLDGKKISLKGSSNGTNLTMTQVPTGGIVSVGTDQQGFAFQGWVSTILGNYILSAGVDLPTGIKVNGQTCTLDGNNELAITRQDGAGGFTEGWFLINYKDPSNTAHKISGNFRVKNM